MSLYSSIYITAAPSLVAETLPSGARAFALDPEVAAEECPGATHEVENCRGYYSPTYRRGHWPSIHALLAYLLAHPQVSAVWYGSDAGYQLDLMTPEKLLRYTADYAWSDRAAFGIPGAGKSIAQLRSLGLDVGFD